MNTLTCALALQAQLDTANERVRQLEAENTMLRETLRLTAEERGNWEREAKKLGAVEWNAHD
jgi:predicted nuclease with TOPRIM domain